MDKRTEIAFLGKARHNLKNPVNAILGYSEMLIEDCEDSALDYLIPDIKKLNQSVVTERNTTYTTLCVDISMESMKIYRMCQNFT